MYADDLKLAMRVRSLQDAQMLQETLSCLYHWCMNNGMRLNIDKCCVVTYTRTKSPLITTYSINDQSLARRDSIRDLGVTFDETLTFVSHTNNIPNE